MIHMAHQRWSGQRWLMASLAVASVDVREYTVRESIHMYILPTCIHLNFPTFCHSMLTYVASAHTG